MCDASFPRRSHLNLAQTSQAFTAEEAKKTVPLPPAKDGEKISGVPQVPEAQHGRSAPEEPFPKIPGVIHGGSVRATPST